MNDVMEQIKTLSATLDEETTRFHPTGRLLLLGSYESVFLKAVKRKADLLGIDCDLTQYPCPPYKAVVVDRTRSEPRKTTGMVRTWFLTTSRQSSSPTTP